MNIFGVIAQRCEFIPILTSFTLCNWKNRLPDERNVRKVIAR